MHKITYERLRSKDHNNLLKAIRTILIETKAHDKQGHKKSIWEWQYKKLPTKLSYIYVAKDKNRIIGYYHIPTYSFKSGKKILKIGNIQSVAIRKKYRKKGIFEKLSSYAINKASRNLDLIYTFPNDKSIHTFLKYNNFSLVETIPMYIRPINFEQFINSRVKIPFFGKLLSLFFSVWRKKSVNLKKGESILEVSLINHQNIKLFENFSKRHKNALVRDFKYINWRYKNSPKSDYFCFSLMRRNSLESSVIFKLEKVLGTDCAIVMDYAYKKMEDIEKLFSNFSNICLVKKSGIRMILLSSVDKDLIALTKNQFIKVPKIINPRNLNLLVKNYRKKLSLNDIKRNCFISLGDWDVF